MENQSTDLESQLMNDPVLAAVIKGPVDRLQTAQTVSNIVNQRNAALNAEAQLQAAEESRLRQQAQQLHPQIAALRNVSAQQAITSGYENQQAVQRAATTAGADVRDPNSTFHKLIAELPNASVRALEANRELQAASSSSILRNPFQWLFDQIRLPSLESKVASSTNEVKILKEGINTMRSAVDDAAQLAKTTANELTPEVVAAKRAQIAKALEQEALTAQIANIHGDTETFQKRISLNHSIMQGVDAARASRIREVQFAQSQQDHAARTQLNTLALEKANLDLTEAREKGVQKAYLDKALVAGFSVFHDTEGKPLSEGAVLAIKANPDLYKKYVEAGVQKLTSGTRAFGASPAEAAQTALQVNSNSASPLLGKLKENLRANFESVQADQSVAKGEKLNAAMAKTNAYIKDEVGIWRRNAETAGSFYAAPTIATVFAADKDGDWSKTLLGPRLAEIKDMKGDVGTVIGVAKEVLKQNPRALDRLVSEINTFYADVAVVNNTQNNFQGVGLPPQDMYVVGKKNYMNAVDVRYELVKSLLIDRGMNMITPGLNTVGYGNAIRAGGQAAMEQQRLRNIGDN